MKALPGLVAIVLSIPSLESSFGQRLPVPDSEPVQAFHFTLPQAEAFAIQNHPQIASAQLTADAVRQEIREARSAFFPQIYGEATAVYAPYDNQTQTATRLAALGGLNNPTVYSRQSDGVVLNQLITDFGRTYELTESAKFQASAANDRVWQAREVVILSVDRNYIEVLRAQAVLKVASETIKERQTAFDQVSVLVKNQLKSAVDQSFAQVALSQAKLFFIQSEGELDAAEAALSTALGFPDAQHFVLAEIPLNLEMPDSAGLLIQLGLKNRPDLEALRQQAESARRFTEAQQAAKYPKVTALAAAGLNPEANDRLLDHNYYAAGINLELPITTGGLLDARTREARYRQLAADKDVIDVQNSIARDIRVAWLNLESDKQRFGVTGELIEASEQAQRLAQARYRLGTSSIVEFNEAELNYTDAALEQTTARYDYQASRALLNFTTGESADFRTNHF